MQAWLARQTRGPKLRLDTYQGQPDITFVRTSLEPIFDEDHTIRQYVERLGSRTRASSISCTSARTGTRAVWERGPQGVGRLALMHVSVPKRRHIQCARRGRDARALHALGAVDEGVPHWFPGGHVADRGDIMDYRALRVDGNGQAAAALDRRTTTSVTARASTPMSLTAATWTRIRSRARPRCALAQSRASRRPEVG